MNSAKQTNQTSWSYIILFVTLFVLAFFVLKVSTASADPGKYMKVTILKGDTLWEIAETYDDRANMKRNEFIRWVETRNHVDSHRLTPGETLIIPVKRH
ncbi:MAG TPA: LysM peptidoglycan-binding domain-containing protein [Bacillales bacterium]|nr:LysM peptidoglycan-binding domain-containing protein [Bacillales bacterium]